MNRNLALAPLLLAAGCATVPSGPIVENGPPAAEGSLVALGRPVAVGRLVATPQAVVEDSRCPENARCVWAGRLIVSTRIDGSGWRETVPLTLGTPYATHGTSIALVSGIPEKRTEVETRPGDYRFAFEGGR